AGKRDQAAQHCLALASLHISAGDLERANERLLEAKRLDPRVSVTGQLRDVRRTQTTPAPPTLPTQRGQNQRILSGSLADISLFDIIQILENSRISGLLQVISSAASGEIYLQEGLIVGSKSGAESGRRALTLLSGANDGTFEVEKNARTYERTIQVTSNT